jgi:hypothetical protein
MLRRDRPAPRQRVGQAEQHHIAAERDPRPGKKQMLTQRESGADAEPGKTRTAA